MFQEYVFRDDIIYHINKLPTNIQPCGCSDNCDKIS